MAKSATPFGLAPWLALWILLALLPGRSAQAQSPQELFKKGVFLISRARFDESIEHLNRARAATKDAALLGRIHLYLGINHSILGDNARCDEAFRTALSFNPRLKLDPRRIKASIVKRFNVIRDASMGELKVEADVDGAEVLVDGKKVGTTPYRSKVVAGGYQVKVLDPGSGASHEERVTVAQGKTLQVTARLAARTRDDAPPPPVRKRIWTWVSAGSAVATLGVAIGLGLSAKSDNDTYNESATLLPDEGAALKSSGNSKALGSSILYGVAGALAATSVVLFFLEGRGGERKTSSARLHVVPGPNPGLVFSTSF